MRYLIIVLCLLATPAWGACKQKDLKGVWLFYASSEFATGWCIIAINKKGKVRPGTQCSTDVANTVIRRGQLNVSSSCVVDGFIADNTGSSNIPVASLADKVLTGVAEGPQVNYAFTAIRHRR